MENRLAFGIGCFHFGIKKVPSLKFKGSEYIKELIKALQSISNIDNISVKSVDEFINESTDVTQELPNIREGNGFFPVPEFMIVEFEVCIPFKIQTQLSKRLQEVGGYSLEEIFTERFKISLWYDRKRFPITFIEPINPSQESLPAEAVIIVRLFLEQEFKSSKSDYIKFEFLGPSPFPVNCYIQSGETQDNNNLDWKIQAKIISHKETYD